MGFEPMIYALKGRCPRPLDDRGERKALPVYILSVSLALAFQAAEPAFGLNSYTVSMLEKIIYLLIATVSVAIVVLTATLLFIRWARRHEPYASFMRLKAGQKLTFFKRIMTDKRVPVYVKILPGFVVLYLIMPFDLIPDFIPVIGYVDDGGIALIGLALVIKLTPRAVIDDLLRR